MSVLYYISQKRVLCSLVRRKAKCIQAGMKRADCSRVPFQPRKAAADLPPPRTLKELRTEHRWSTALPALGHPQRTTGTTHRNRSWPVAKQRQHLPKPLLLSRNTDLPPDGEISIERRQRKFSLIYIAGPDVVLENLGTCTTIQLFTGQT